MSEEFSLDEISFINSRRYSLNRQPKSDGLWRLHGAFSNTEKSNEKSALPKKADSTFYSQENISKFWNARWQQSCHNTYLTCILEAVIHHQSISQLLASLLTIFEESDNNLARCCHPPVSGRETQFRGSNYLSVKNRCKTCIVEVLHSSHNHSTIASSVLQ
eukprot:scaffold20611_cov77-Cyclotella_meneghiniana.AAC.1